MLWGAVNNTSVDYALGISQSTLLTSIPTSSETYKWYAGESVVASLTGGSVFGVDQVNTSKIYGGQSFYIQNDFTGTSKTTFGINTSYIDTYLLVRIFDDNRPQPISYDWNNLANSIGGGFSCHVESIFHKPVLFSRKYTKSNTGISYRSYGYGGEGVYSNGGNYSLIIGGQGRILVGEGSELNVYCDIRGKECVETFDAVAALETVKNVRCVQFQYKR